MTVPSPARAGLRRRRGAGDSHYGLPVTLVHAADGKSARAEPVAVLFESGKAKLAGRFPELEAELAGLTYGRGYQGPGRSPDRAAVMVWALTELLVGKRRAEPRISLLWRRPPAGPGKLRENGWRTRQDSNLWPLPSEGSALSS